MCEKGFCACPGAARARVARHSIAREQRPLALCEMRMRLALGLCAVAGAYTGPVGGSGNHSVLTSSMLHGWHSISAAWPVGSSVDGIIRIEDLLGAAWRANLRPRTIALADICHKDMKRPDAAGASYAGYCGKKLSDSRASRGPADVPGVLLDAGGANPCGSRYTMLDGAHRACRLKLAGATRGRYFVFDVAAARALVTTRSAANKNGSKPQSQRVARRDPLSREEAMDLVWWLAEIYYGEVPA